MLHYADNQREIEPRSVLSRTALDLDAAGGALASGGSDALLTWHPALVGAVMALGEIHQAMADRISPVEDEVSEETDRLAAAGIAIGRCVYRSWKELGAASSEYSATVRQPGSALVSLVEQAREAVVACGELDLPRRLTIQVPEGFAFYSLYPEMYFRSLERLLTERAAPDGCFVIGIRSIGTSLAALVGGALAELDIDVRTETVRPRGHPFERYLSISPGLRKRFEAAGPSASFLIVDEGPGLTCSSFLSVCSLLEQMGISPSRIAILAAWMGAPSIYASEELRASWQRQRVFYTDAADAFGGWKALLPFVESQLGRSGQSEGKRSRDEWEISDISYGRWREVVYPSADRWPTVHRPTERTKLLLGGRRHPAPSSQDNTESAVPNPSSSPRGSRLFAKFAGLGTYGTEKLERAAILAEAGLAPPVVGLAYGFLIYRFAEGRPLDHSDISPALISRMAEYYGFIRKTFGRPAEPRFERLAEIVTFNSRQAIEADAKSFIDRWRDRAGEVDSQPLVALDGRPFPHEWIETVGMDGPVYIKTDGADHFHDHTLVGNQSIAWDLAGACEEWEMDGSQVDALLQNWEMETGDATCRTLLEFYRAAYLAFRTGALHFAVHSTDEVDIRQALQHRQHIVNTRLASVLACGGVQIPSRAS